MSGRASGSEGGNVASLRNTVGKGEFDLRVMEHLDSDALGIGGLDSLNLQDMDAVGLGTMAGSHVTIGLCDGAGYRHVTVLAVHVVVAGSGVILEPHSEVLDGASALGENFLAGKNFSTGFLHTTKHRNKVPETGLGDDLVASEDLHFPDRGDWLILRGDLTSNDGVLLQYLSESLGRHV